VSMDEVGLGQLLQDARKKAGLTQQELCHRSGLSYSTLAKIERGAIKAPSIFTIQSIAAALGTNLNDLIGVPAPSGTPKKLSKSGVRFVYFDINGCLVRFYHRAFTEIARDSGKQADVVETTFWHYNDAVCRGEMPLDEFNQILGERFELPEFDWLSYYFATIDPIDEMEELLAWASEHYNVGLLSNIMPGQIDTMLTKGILPNIKYSAIIDSSEVKAIKPESRIFEIAAEKSGVQPGEILFVDDSRANIMAAEKFGWHVLWFDDFRPDDSVKRIRSALEF
jgi:FMN phosphatase YigB (HAD superfamily)/DNA-binding XRE family transcriptional regulator